MGDPTETALVKAFFKDVKSIKAFIENKERVYEIPFDSTRKMMTVVMNINGRETCYLKGAPERVIERCSFFLENGKVKPLTQQKKRQIYSFVESLSNRALRWLAGAYREDNIV